jgi:hypothetical protein
VERAPKIPVKNVALVGNKAMAALELAQKRQLPTIRFVGCTVLCGKVPMYLDITYWALDGLENLTQEPRLTLWAKIARKADVRPL